MFQNLQHFCFQTADVEDIRNFKPGFTFDGEKSGKKLHTYKFVDDIYIDENGNETGDSVDLSPCDYILSEVSYHSIVEYINENLKNSVSIKKLSEKLNISESALTHTFKKEMGISVHKYIQQKRLVFARKLIEEGKKPTKIYFDLGYSEYSAFYKAYFKMFGHPPSNKYK